MVLWKSNLHIIRHSSSLSSLFPFLILCCVVSYHPSSSLINIILFILLCIDVTVPPAQAFILYLCQIIYFKMVVFCKKHIFKCPAVVHFYGIQFLTYKIQILSLLPQSRVSGLHSLKISFFFC